MTRIEILLMGQLGSDERPQLMMSAHPNLSDHEWIALADYIKEEISKNRVEKLRRDDEQ